MLFCRHILPAIAAVTSLARAMPGNVLLFENGGFLDWRCLEVNANFLEVKMLFHN